MYVCICAAVTDDEVRASIRDGARTVDDVGDACGAGTGCGTCHDRIGLLLLAAGAPAQFTALPAPA